MAVVNRHSVSLGRAPLSTDLEAQRAAAEICRGLPAKGAPPAALVEFALRAHGLTDPPPHLVVGGVSTGDDVPTTLASKIEGLLARRPYRRVGLGRCAPPRSSGAGRLVVALYEDRVRVDPVPRRIRLGASARLRARVAESHRDVALVVANPRGKVQKRPLENHAGVLVGAVPCAERGVYRVEMTGVGRHGAEVLANFPVYCGQRPPVEVRYVAALPTSYRSEALEGRLFALTNAFRQRRGLPALSVHTKLAAVARQHCEDMRGAGFVGHRSASTGSPGDRVRRAGIVALVVRENVARAYSVEEALEQLATSPAHLENLTSRDVTHVGIGVVVDRRASVPALLITQNFIRPAMPFRLEGARVDLLRRVQGQRKKSGLAALRQSKVLGRLASRYLALEGGQGRKAADSWLSQELRRLGRRYRQVGGVMLKARALEVMSQAADWRRAEARDVGIAFARRGDVIVLFALLATPR